MRHASLPDKCTWYDPAMPPRLCQCAQLHWIGCGTQFSQIPVLQKTKCGWCLASAKAEFDSTPQPLRAQPVSVRDPVPTVVTQLHRRPNQSRPDPWLLSPFKPSSSKNWCATVTHMCQQHSLLWCHCPHGYGCVITYTMLCCDRPLPERHKVCQRTPDVACCSSFLLL